MDATRLYFNGIDARSGRYLTAPLTLAEVADLAAGEARPPGWLAALRDRLGGLFLGLPFATDPLDLAASGWAVVFPADAPAAVRTALEPLVEHRRRQCGERLRVLDVRPGETCRAWLDRHGASWGSVRPERVPYYLLLVGGPEKIPFDFQFQLLDYAVGRLDLEGPAAYRTYAESLVALAGEAPRAPSAAVFAPCLDRATELSDRLLAAPLASELTAAGFEVASRREDGATRDGLLDLLAGHRGRRPDLLFAASHGVGWPAGDPAQRDGQGALLCAGWREGEVVDPARHLVAARDLDDARVHGLVAFLFACDGAGTPALGSPRRPGTKPPRLAPSAFVAALPRRLLAHPAGAARAVVGHVDQVWSFSFVSPASGEQRQPFTNSLRALLAGEPVGHALRDFRQRHAALAVELDHLLRLRGWGLGVPADEREPLARAWLERNDAEGWIVLGDPAARLAVARS